MSWKGVGAKCEAAGAKCVLKSYVDAGNNLLTSEDIYHALHYGNGIQNAEISVVAIDAKNSMSSSKTTIPKISQYHSFEYFGTGLGKRWNYTGAKFQPAIQVLQVNKIILIANQNDHAWIEAITVLSFVLKLVAVRHLKMMLVLKNTCFLSNTIF